ncbi:MAG: hypothetical protein ACJ0BT_01965, partial [Pseudohongiellaceae bacterium]
EDLKNKILRHVSPAFSEDPLRVLRVARFSARFAHLGFKVTQDTLELMQHLVNNSELDELPPERVWQEFKRALGEKTPAFFFITLRECYALGVVMQEIESLFGISQEKARRSLMALTKAAELSLDTAVRFSALCYELPITHDFSMDKNLRKLEALCERLRIPNDHKDLATITCLYWDNYASLTLNEAEPILRLFEECDAIRRPERFQLFLISCKAIRKASDENEAHIDFRNRALLTILDLCQNVDSSILIKADYKKEEFGNQMRLLRLAELENYLNNLNNEK